MSPRRMLWVGSGVFTIGLVAALAHAQHALSVEIVPPPAPLPMRTVAVAEKAFPSPPSVPQLVPPSQLEPTEAILWQIREVCELLKRPDMTVTEMAMRLGTITFDAGGISGLVVRPASRYFNEAQVYAEHSVDGSHAIETADSVNLILAEPRQLPMSALELAFGKGKNFSHPDGWGQFPMLLTWPKQPRGPIQCEMDIHKDWRSNYGYKKGVAMEVEIIRTTPE